MPTPEEVHERTRAFLRDHPDARSALETLLGGDAETSWAFEDIDLDSGRFGELVSREIVSEADDGGYRLRHPEAVAAAVAGEPLGADSSPIPNTDTMRSSLRAYISPRELGGLIAALTLVAGARLIAYGDVLRDGYVVSPGNDPYFYRYWQARLLDRSDGVTDFGVIANLGGAESRPLTHVLNWWLAELLGGTPDAATTVAAWLPIAGAVGTGVVLYLLAKALTDDSRIGLLAVGFYAVAPVHVVYTNVGFLEHRLHQYFWLGVLALSLTWLAVDVQRRRERTSERPAALAHLRAPRSWLVAGVLALAVAASAHIWTGSPLTFIPVAVYIAFRVIVDVKTGVSPLAANAPAIGGLAIGGLLAMVAHLGLGWHELLAALTPGLLAIGAVAVAGLAELWHRLERPPHQLLVAEGVAVGVGLAGFLFIEPIETDRITGRLDNLLFREGATETGSLFAAEHAFVLGPLWQIGISYYFGLIALAVVTGLVVRRYEPGWLLAVCFGWYYMLLAAFQTRFAAQLVVFISLFAGVGGLYLLAKVDLVRPVGLFRDGDDAERDRFEIPGGRHAGYLAGTLSVLLIFNMIFVPSLVGQTTYSDEQFETALAIDSHADELDRGYPETAVETEWGEIRMYNYFVNGESSSYNSRYEQLLAAEHPDARADGLREGGNYVVINEIEESPPGSYEILFEGLGVGYGDVETTAGRYQPVYIGESHRAFTAVDGAVLNVTGATDGTTVTATTNVEINDEVVPYERHGEVDDGTVDLRVAHPGEYTVGGETVTVDETTVHDGGQINVRVG